MKLRFLGTGTSVGVPQIGCKCRVCTSADPRDRRKRCGLHVTLSSGFAFLVDTPPEMRLACVEYGVEKVDAVLLTHAHMDHVAGFDDVRRFNSINGMKVECDPGSPGANGRPFKIVGKPMECRALPETIESMHKIFPYVGTQGGLRGLFRPQIEFVPCEAPFELGGARISPLRVEHGFPCCGYLVEDPAAGGAISRLAYFPDCHSMPPETEEAINGVDLLVIDCLRKREHPTHMTLERVLELCRRVEPRRTLLTHMCHDLTHQDWEAGTPDGVEPAFDGMEATL